jgi:hypothetical protein
MVASGMLCLASLLGVLVWFGITTVGATVGAHSRPPSPVSLRRGSFLSHRRRRDRQQSISSTNSSAVTLAATTPARLGTRLREEWEVEEAEIDDLDHRRRAGDIGGKGYRQVSGYGGDEWGVGENEGEALAWGLRRASFIELNRASLSGEQPSRVSVGELGRGELGRVSVAEMNLVPAAGPSGPRASWDPSGISAGGGGGVTASNAAGAIGVGLGLGRGPSPIAGMNYYPYKHVLRGSGGSGGARRASEASRFTMGGDDNRRRRRRDSCALSSGSIDRASVPGPL